jgi:hypothetical protein
VLTVFQMAIAFLLAPALTGIALVLIAVGVSASLLTGDANNLPHVLQHFPRLIWRLSIKCRPVILLVVGVLRLWIVAADRGLVRLCWGCVPPMPYDYLDLIKLEPETCPMADLTCLFSAPKHAPEGSPVFRSPKRPWSAPKVIKSTDLPTTRKTHVAPPQGDEHLTHSDLVS